MICESCGEGFTPETVDDVCCFLCVMAPQDKKYRAIDSDEFYFSLRIVDRRLDKKIDLMDQNSEIVLGGGLTLPPQGKNWINGHHKHQKPVYKPRVCECGATFIPKGTRQFKCIKCRPTKKQKWQEHLRICKEHYRKKKAGELPIIAPRPEYRPYSKIKSIAL